MKSYILFITVLAFVFLSSCQQERNKANDITWEPLFNGQDLTGWYTWQRAPEPSSEVEGIPRNADGQYMEPIGLNKDPLNVFTVVQEDDLPAIRISGETFGILVTDKPFSNYHLKLEFKWGDEKYPPRVDELMDSGILYHSTGPEGAWGGVWMKSLECQVMEGATGDFICVDTTTADIPAVRKSPDGRYHYEKGAVRVTFHIGNGYCVKGQDHERPVGEWNIVEIYAYGNESIHMVNGQVILHAYNLRYIEDGREVLLTKGKIQLQSEGAEIFYRNIAIREIDGIPEGL